MLYLGGNMGRTSDVAAFVVANSDVVAIKTQVTSVHMQTLKTQIFTATGVFRKNCFRHISEWITGQTVEK